MLEDDTMPSVPRAGESAIDRRYKLGDVIGRGGMGEVRLAKDTTIDRDVAIKLMHGQADKNLTARFFREARVQGQLEHPAVVPVHDLGIDSAGQPYFVMKRLAGTTMHDVLAGKTTPQRTLLARLVDICLAIDFAHERGVVHRDLKPANIMLGNYGDAYVLDWGLARIVDEHSSLHVEQSPSRDGQTQRGALLGTLGYMSPEQARGEDVDTGTDVFALGLILYEILAGEPALPRGAAALEPTRTAKDHRPSARADVPPELDELCAKATAQDRTQRPSARQLADAIQGYLDGDRDLERRRELAASHLMRAQEALAYADDTGRAIAMREAGRAFVLDPTNKSAQDVIAHLTLEGPHTMPVQALAEADRERGEQRRQVFGWAIWIYVITATLLGLMFVFPVRHPTPLVLAICACLLQAALNWHASQRLRPMMTPLYLVLLAVNCAILIATGYIFGPLLVVPMYVCGSLTVCVSIPIRFPAWPIIAAHVVAVAIPIATELLGITPDTFSLTAGQVTLRPYAVDLSPLTFVIVLAIAFGAQITNATLIALTQRRTQELALDAVHKQSWHLRQLLPDVHADDERS